MSSIFNEKYISVTYKNNKSNYPVKFCKEIIKKFNIPIGSKILDIGCGNGLFADAFSKLGMNVYGIDVSRESQSILSDHFKVCDLSKKPYPFKDREFDFVFSKSVIEHLRNPDVLIDEAHRMLKPGGIFICMTPSWKHSHKEAFYIDHTHVTPFTKHSLETICELSGFRAECEYFYQLPLLWKYPILNIGRIALNAFNLPYRPLYKVKWSDGINKAIRFSREAMLICKAEKV